MADISRTDAEGLLAEQNIWEVIEDAERSSAALSAFRRVTMGTKNARMPVLSALPTAGFVGEGSAKPTSEAKWGNLNLTAEEIAVIVPVHENVFDDAELNIWDQVRPLVATEFGRVLDSAVFFSTNKPSTWPAGLVPGARAAGNLYDIAAAEAAGEDLADQVNEVWALVEGDGYDVNSNFTARFMRSKLRGLRATDGQPIYLDSLRGDRSTPMIYGEDLFYVQNGSWVRAADPDGGVAGDEVGADLLSGDSTAAILGVREDVQWKILTEATVGGLNLAELDMIAIRAKFRVAFQVAKPLNPENFDRGTGAQKAGVYPFATLAYAVTGV